MSPVTTILHYFTITDTVDKKDIDSYITIDAGLGGGTNSSSRSEAIVKVTGQRPRTTKCVDIDGRHGVCQFILRIPAGATIATTAEED